LRAHLQALATNVFALFLSAMLVWAGIVHSVLS
jgi:hypothetical protein